MLRDIIERESIRNVSLLRTLVRFIADNIGKQFSARSIVGVLKSQNTETSTNMVLNYLEYLCNAYIIDRIGRYNIHGKKILELGDSFYFEDLGLRNHLVGGNRRFDIEKLMENAVYRHLLRLGYIILSILASFTKLKSTLLQRNKVAPYTFKCAICLPLKIQ